jgi:hypothetical protein
MPVLLNLQGAAPHAPFPSRKKRCLQALDALYESQHAAQRATFRAFYSSELGGIVTDPALFVVPQDDHMLHRGHAGACQVGQLVPHSPGSRLPPSRRLAWSSWTAKRGHAVVIWLGIDAQAGVRPAGALATSVPRGLKQCAVTNPAGARSAALPAVFDTAQLVGGQLYQLDAHLRRFLTSAAKANIPLPAGMSVEQMRRTILETTATSCKLNGARRTKLRQQAAPQRDWCCPWAAQDQPCWDIWVGPAVYL